MHYLVAGPYLSTESQQGVFSSSTMHLPSRRRCGRTDITARFALMIKFGAVTIGAVAIALVALLPEGDA